MGNHLIEEEFQSDKYPTCPAGKVPLSTKDPMAQDLLYEYAKRRMEVDAEFSTDLLMALELKGFEPEVMNIDELRDHIRELMHKHGIKHFAVMMDDGEHEAMDHKAPYSWLIGNAEMLKRRVLDSLAEETETVNRAEGDDEITTMP